MNRSPFPRRRKWAVILFARRDKKVRHPAGTMHRAVELIRAGYATHDKVERIEVVCNRAKIRSAIAP